MLVSVLIATVTNFLGLNLEHSLKTTRFIDVQSRFLPIQNATLFLPSSKYRRFSCTKKFGSEMEQKLFDG